MSASSESPTLSQRVLLALKETRSKLEVYERARSEPIAIIGMGCRFPGEADGPDLFWDLLCRGADAVREVPADRWDVDSYYDPDPGTPGKTCVRSAGFLRQIDLFDGQFFGIAPREARSMDPQQRLLLEVAWEAIEQAGQGHNDLFGKRVGVFIGIGNCDYARLMHEFARPESIDLYSTTGNVFSAAAGRLSYVLGLQGPSISLDTACSSSLVAVHLACQSLRAEESVLALAGGVNLILSPHTMVAMSKIPGGLAPDGRCKSFDASANGIARGEGCGLVVLKRLSDAIRDRDNIVALIRGSAVNQDGRSAGLTVPNGKAQIGLIEQALSGARVSSDQISYVEAHGPGTALGDPIEAGALSAVFGQSGSRKQPLIVGSVKTNIGHLESAAGVAGLIKTALILQHGEVPPNLHFKQPNPHIAWDRATLEIPTERTPLAAQARSHVAGVSSFGVSGTNAHVILEEPPRNANTPSGERMHRGAPKYLLTLSAKDEHALLELCGRYRGHLERHPQLALIDVCHTASVGRFHFPRRLAVLAESAADMKAQLESARLGRSRVFRGEASSAPSVGFLFPNAAIVSADAVRELSDRCSVFRNALDRCDQLLQEKAGCSQHVALVPEKTDGSHPAVGPQSGVALVSFAYALAELWRSWGIVPSVVTAQGIGEVTAACVAGVMSLEQALELALAWTTLRDSGQRAQSIAAHLGQVLAQISCAKPRIPIVSHLTGERTADEMGSLDYWVRAFETSGTRSSPPFANEKIDVVLEAGPGSSWEASVESLAKLYVEGATIVWESFYRDLSCARVPLPTYPFQRQRYWFEQKEPQEKARVESAPSVADPPGNQLYQEEWRRRPLQEAPAPTSSAVGTWLILADGNGIGCAAARQLEADGNTCVIVRPGRSYEEAEDGEIRLDPASMEDFERLMARLAESYPPPLQGIIHLWSIDTDEPSSLPELKETLRAECGSMLHLARAVIKAHFEPVPKVWLVTQGAVQVDEKEVPAIAQSPIWAMTGVLEHEHPELGWARIDLDPTAGSPAPLLREIRASSDDRRVALRGEQRLVARLARYRQPPAVGPLAFDPDATYLITGGLGGLGRLLAEWLIAKGARHIVLLGRNPPKPEAGAHIEHLRRSGAELAVLATDVSDPQALEGALSRIDAARPLRGIFHCAAVLEDGIIVNQTWERFERVLRPKVDGAWNLHALTRDSSLDFFVLFSSAAALLGNPGQSNYAAANGFLDALARWRHARGMPGLSINWGIWSGVGRVATGELETTLNATGLGRIAPQEGLKALERLLTHPSPHVAMMPIHWPELAARAGHWRFIEDFRESPGSKQNVVPPFIESVKKAPARERRTLLLNHVRSQVEQVLGMRSAVAVSAKQGFFEMGMDSLTSVELKNRLQTTLGCKLPATVAFECPTVEALVNYLARENLAWLFASDQDTGKRATNGDHEEPLEQISEDDVGRLLDERLEVVETFLQK